MNRVLSALLLASAALLGACGGSSSSSSGGGSRLGPPTLTALAQCTGALAGLTYAADTKAIFDNNCTRCHASTLSGALRNGAPADHNFDTLAGIKADPTHLDHIDRVAGMNPSGGVRNAAMPPTAPTPTDLERQKLSCWIVEGAN